MLNLAVQQYLLRELSGPGSGKSSKSTSSAALNAVEALEIGITGRFWTRVATCPISPFLHRYREDTLFASMMRL